jgi:hypothetical protein
VKQYNLKLQKKVIFILIAAMIILPILNFVLDSQGFSNGTLSGMAIISLILAGIALLIFLSDAEFKRNVVGPEIYLPKNWTTVSVGKTMNIAERLFAVWSVICAIFAVYFFFIFRNLDSWLYAVVYLYTFSGIFIYTLAHLYIIIDGSNLYYDFPSVSFQNMPTNEDFLKIITRQLKNFNLSWIKPTASKNKIKLYQLGLEIHYPSDVMAHDITVKIQPDANKSDVLQIVRLIDHMGRGLAMNKLQSLDTTLKYVFKKTVQKKIQKKLDLSTLTETKKTIVPEWLDPGLEFVYSYDQKYKPPMDKTIFKVWQKKDGEYFIDVDNVYPLGTDIVDVRIDDVIPLNSEVPVGFFIKPEPHQQDPWHQLKKEGFKNLGKEEVEIPLGIYLSILFFRSASEPCNCKIKKNRAGVCWHCEGSGKTEGGIVKCKQCKGTGQCRLCKGKGTIEYETFLWYEPVTGIKLKTGRKTGNRIVMIEELEKIKPYNILDKLSHIG